ncbi:BH3-interacting domain death agonist [Acomys russatus]|uniref:BH3-interacting domain death agonist n=1 Tax=Acomys russatus TaxID=60746 RepID=UPI0021E2386D|nr:BH3-interacting domain death agonist [Acomys russatus]XP_051011235.1 BH3-interacting domain death agonist [Acomys russatus]
MDSEVSNGSGLEAECITNLLVFGFLQSSGYNFQELEKLGQELPVHVYPEADLEDELQTDGNRASRSFYRGRIEPDSGSQEEIIQNIARHLAQVGDELDHSIQPTLVRQLATQFTNSLSEEDRRNCLAKALDEVKTAYPRDMENDKAMLIMTMLLAKKVANHTPSLLRDVFRTTVNFINQNLLTYVRNLVRNVRTHYASAWLLGEPYGPCLPVLTQQSLCLSPSHLLLLTNHDCSGEAKAGSHYWWDPGRVGRHGA